MKIRIKLAILFTSIYSLVILILLIFNYFTSYNYAIKSFYSRIEERAFIASQIYLKKDELSKLEYLPYTYSYQNKLNKEIVQIYDAFNKNVFIEKSPEINIGSDVLDKIRYQKEFSFSEGDRQFYGISVRDNQGDFLIVASAKDLIGQAKLKHLLSMMIVGFIISTIIIYFFGINFAKNALKPITDIVNQVKNITATNLKIRVKEDKNKDEISELASTFNNVLEKLESAFEMQKTFVSNASHELRTPLTAIITELELLQLREREKDDYKVAISNVLTEVQQLNDFINNLLSIAQTDISDNNTKLNEIRLDEILMDIKGELVKKYPYTNIKIQFLDLPEEPSLLTIYGNKQLLQVAFMNIFDNAIKFSNNQEVQCTLSSKNGKTIISIIDKGIGISASDLKNIYQPFYRAVNASGFPGHGVGLALSEKIFRLHGGRIHIDSVVCKGTKVEIIFVK